ncbi:MAG: ATP-binding protein [Prevotella sp.]|nr:ATP-binding protein [Prevotella sp.]
MADNKQNKNPWKGLNFYVEGEVLYGRDSEIESLSQYIINNTQTVLYGKSGIGKSSILNAGVFPIARRKGLLPVGIRLDHSMPVSYVRQIRTAIESHTDIVVHQILPAINDDEETLWEYLHRNIFFNTDGQRVQLLIVLDQFEEIFTLQQNEKRKRAFFADLADLLNDVTPLYIVNANKQQDPAPQPDDAQEVTTELGDLDLDLDLDRVTAESSPRYLPKPDYHIVFTLREDFLSYLERYTAYIPVMKSNRYALLPINEEQAADIIMKPCPGLVSREVAELIIQKITGEEDFHLDGIPQFDVDAAVLSLYLSRLFIKKGPQADSITADLIYQFSDDIIKDFYEESVADLAPSDIEKIEDQLITYDGRRNNVSRSDLISEGVSAEAIRLLVKDRKLLRQFSYQDDIRVEFMHDILCPVVDARINQREAVKHQQEEHRYQEAMLRKSRQRLFFSIGSSVVLALLVVLFWVFFIMPFSNSYAAFTTRNGWPVGVGPKLTAQDKSQMVVHYRLTRNGLLQSFHLLGIDYYRPYTKVEVLNQHSLPATNILVESPLVSLDESDRHDSQDPQARAFAQLQLHTAYWKFVADEEGNIARQTAYNLRDSVLYSIQFYRSKSNEDDTQAETLWMNYVDADGKSLRVRSNGADRMRVTQSQGYYTGYIFYNELGTPQHNSRWAYGYNYTINPGSGVTEAVIPLDEYGNSIPNQSLHFSEFDQYQRWTAAANGARAEYGPHHIIYNMGIRIDTLRYDDDGRQIYRSETNVGLQWHKFAYDNRGNLIENSTFKLASNGAVRPIRRLLCEYFDNSDVLSRRTRYVDTAAVKYQCEIHEINGNTHVVTHFKGNTLASLQMANVRMDSISYHRMTTTTDQQDSIRLKTVTYTEIDEQTFADTHQWRKETAYDAHGQLLREIIWSDGKQTQALEYEIEGGQVVGQHVIGLTGQPIRCPSLDNHTPHLSYYRLRFVRNFLGDTIAIKAINEFGETSIVTLKNQEYRVEPLAGHKMYKLSFEDEEPTITAGIQYKKEFLNEAPDNVVDYLHITDTTGTYYRSGLRDGDIILSIGQDVVEVARPLPTENRYQVLPPIKLLQGNNPGMEHYDVYFTDLEIRRFKESIRK